MPGLQKEISNWCDWAYQSLPAWQRETQQVIIREIHEMNRTGQTFVRLAGLSGALSVALAAYGAHAFAPDTSDPKLKLVFQTGNQQHMIHSVVLLAVPLTRRPYLVGPMLATGILLFSGTCYYHAFTGSTKIRKFTPYGGMLLIGAWLAMIL